MKIIPEKYPAVCYGVFLLVCICVATIYIANTARAAVRGVCSNCHTMHNSQDGSLIQPSPDSHLLTEDCVGCHSSSGSETIVTLGNTRIPIVFNTTAYPSAPLAGGNFYKVSLGGAANDVYGIMFWGFPVLILIFPGHQVMGRVVGWPKAVTGVWL